MTKGFKSVSHSRRIFKKLLDAVTLVHTFLVSYVTFIVYKPPLFVLNSKKYFLPFLKSSSFILDPGNL